MGKLRKQNSNLPAFPRITPDKTETFAGKWTARVTRYSISLMALLLKRPEKSTKMGA